MKTEILSLVLFIFMCTSLQAQIQNFDEVSMRKNQAKSSWIDLGKKENLKEARLQVDFYLNQKDAENYIYIVDGQVLPVADFKEYKDSVLKQARAIHFVKGIDSVMGYPSHRKRMLILVTTDVSEN